MHPEKAEIQSEFDINNPEFSAAWQLLNDTSQSVFLTGKAGTGKSTFLRHLTGKTKKKFVVLAPTGIAAVNVGGQTLHSFFRIPLKPLLPDDPDFAVTKLRQRLKYSKQFIKLLKAIDLIIIDEISMVRADVIDFIDRVLRVYTGNMRLPFGGKQMLFVGDVFQLDPVVTGNDRDILSHSYTAFNFFNAFVFKEIDLVPIELTKVYRQEEKSFVEILDRIRMGKPSTQDLVTLNSRVTRNDERNIDESSEYTMTIATRREMVDAINERHLGELKTPSIIFKGTIEKDFPDSSLPTDLNLELKVGAQVVFVRNDPEKRWVNGSLGKVTQCLPDLLTVKTEDGEEHEVQMEKWLNVKYVFNEKTRQVDEIELGSFCQYPVKAAWALTIHKSQGLTFNNVIIDLGKGAFSGGQTYVALSRSRSLEGIKLLSPIRERDIYVKPEIERFARLFNNKGLFENAVNTSKAELLYKSASQAIDRGNFAEALENYAEALTLKPEIGRRDDVKRLVRLKTRKIDELTYQIAELKGKLNEERRKLTEVARSYVNSANELSGEGWEADSALAQYNRALDLVDDYAPAIYGKATLLLKIGRLDEAYNLFNLLAAGKSQDSWKGFLGIGQIYESDGDDFNAVSMYLKAHEAVPKNKTPLKHLIDVFIKLRDFESANIYKNKLRRLSQ